MLPVYFLFVVTNAHGGVSVWSVSSWSYTSHEAHVLCALPDHPRYGPLCVTSSCSYQRVRNDARCSYARNKRVLVAIWACAAARMRTWGGMLKLRCARSLLAREANILRRLCRRTSRKAADRSHGSCTATSGTSWTTPSGFDTGLKTYNSLTKRKEPLVLARDGVATWWEGPFTPKLSNFGPRGQY